MIIDGIPLDQYLGMADADLRSKALLSFVDVMEKRLGARFLYDARSVPFGRADLIEPLRLAALLEEKGIIRTFGRLPSLPDEPPTKGWYAVCNIPTGHRVGGSTFERDGNALLAALAEALERYIWYTCEDYYVAARRATVEEIRRHGPFLPPEEIAGFSSEQRADAPERQLRRDARYLWIRGRSLVRGKNVYVPSQIISGVLPSDERGGAKEPLIRQRTTNGLATWPTLTGARLAGALELIEREAYMIMWLNQLTLTRIPTTQLCSRYPDLGRFLSMCERYRLKTHVIRLLTDAPAHAVAVVFEDTSGNAPRFTVGLKAHRSLSFAVEKAMTEALRARLGYRSWTSEGNTWDPSFPADKVGHRDRLYYWALPEFASKLEFMIRGAETQIDAQPWDADGEEKHFGRILQWCRDKHFECIAVSLGRSAKNPTPFEIEMTVIPQLQPTYLMEKMRALGGTRWQDVPKSFGYAPLQKPFTDAPHPFS